MVHLRVNVVRCVHTAISRLRSGTGDDPQGLETFTGVVLHRHRPSLVMFSLMSPNSVPLKGLITLLLSDSSPSVVRCI